MKMKLAPLTGRGAHILFLRTLSAKFRGVVVSDVTARSAGDG